MRSGLARPGGNSRKQARWVCAELLSLPLGESLLSPARDRSRRGLSAAQARAVSLEWRLWQNLALMVFCFVFFSQLSEKKKLSQIEFFSHNFSHKFLAHAIIWRWLLLFSRSVVSDSLQPHGLQRTRPPCPSPTSGACSNSCPLSQWHHPTISSSVVPFSSCLQSFPTSGSFPMSWLLSSGGQSIGASALASVSPMNIQGWRHLGWTLKGPAPGASPQSGAPAVEDRQPPPSQETPGCDPLACVPELQPRGWNSGYSVLKGPGSQQEQTEASPERTGSHLSPFLKDQRDGSSWSIVTEHMGQQLTWCRPRTESHHKETGAKFKEDAILGGVFCFKKWKMENVRKENTTVRTDRLDFHKNQRKHPKCNTCVKLAIAGTVWTACQVCGERLNELRITFAGVPGTTSGEVSSHEKTNALGCIKQRASASQTTVWRDGKTSYKPEVFCNPHTTQGWPPEQRKTWDIK